MAKRTALFVAASMALMTNPACPAPCPTAGIAAAVGANPIYRFGADTRLTCVGAISHAGRSYLIVDYDWAESVQGAAAHGGTPHAAHRLMVLAQAHGRLTYVGFYGTDSAPLAVTDDRIRLEGGEIVFGRDGPPAQALVDGELRVLGR